MWQNAVNSTVDSSTVAVDRSLVSGQIIRKVQVDLSAVSQGGLGGRKTVVSWQITDLHSNNQEIQM